MFTEAIKKAKGVLKDQFGPTWTAPYAAGKAEMAAQLCQRLGMPHEAAVTMLKELERDGDLDYSPAVPDRRSEGGFALGNPEGVEPAVDAPDSANLGGTEQAMRRPGVGVWRIDPDGARYSSVSPPDAPRRPRDEA